MVRWDLRERLARKNVGWPRCRNTKRPIRRSGSTGPGASVDPVTAPTITRPASQVAWAPGSSRYWGRGPSSSPAHAALHGVTPSTTSATRSVFGNRRTAISQGTGPAGTPSYPPTAPAERHPGELAARPPRSVEQDNGYTHALRRRSPVVGLVRPARWGDRRPGHPRLPRRCAHRRQRGQSVAVAVARGGPVHAGRHR